MMSQPRGDRWHTRSTALLGGIAIYVAFLVGFLAFWPQLPGGARLILAGGTALFLLGIVDDFRTIKPPVKLVSQLIVAAIVVYFGKKLPWTSSNALNTFITIFWLVGMTNAVNLLDNMDGLAAGIVVIACGFMSLNFTLNGQYTEALLPALAGGAALGFFFYNISPALIFMGDCGSMFLGFTMGGMALLSAYDRTRHVSTVLMTPVLIMLIPIFDTTIVTITRKLAGRPVSQGGRDHTSHRLVALGISERRAVILMFALSITSGLLALTLRSMSLQIMLSAIVVFVLILFFIGVYLSKVRVYEEGVQLENKTIMRALAGFTYKRRFFEIILDVVLIALAYQSAYLLRFEGSMPENQVAIFVQTLPLVVAIQLASFLFGGVYGGIWRYASISDLLLLARSVVIGGIVSGLLVFWLFGWRGPSRTVFVLDAMLLVLLVGASRLSFRLLRSAIVGRTEVRADARPIFIYGAGDGGELLLREILNNSDYRYTPIGFIDDDSTKFGKLIHGYPIYSSEDLPGLIKTHEVNDVLISSSKIPESTLGRLRGLGIYLGRMKIRIENEPDIQLNEVKIDTL
jgi:UDP-GlcNAc:undecaprenyl-phosphate/decaprenyl-phosphate GlcNAc-1-phosphate transferase